AGADQVIARPQSFAILDGTASANAVSYKWRKLTATDFDFKANLKNSDSAKADILILPYKVGGYDFELTVTNTNGCVSKDTTNVMVDWGEAPPQSTDGFAGWHFATATDVAQIPTARIGDVIINGARAGSLENGDFTNIYIYPTSALNLKEGQKVLIKAGKYGSIVLNLGEGVLKGSSSNPVIITNYGGQVECTMMTVTNAIGAKITGKYVPGVSGDVNFKGHADGDFAYSRGTYGIYCNNGWSSLASVGMKINGQVTDSLEIEFVEVGNGNFAGMQIKQDEGTNDYDGFNIHDIYIHDIHGEGMYLGSTSSGQRHKLNGWTLKNIRIVNAGNEIFQMGNIGANTSIRNNVFINAATNWKSPFNIFQDNGVQLSFNNGRCEFRNNIVLGAGHQLFNGFSGLRPDLPYNGDSIFINNNLMKYARGPIGAYWGSGSEPINGLVIKLDSNYFGGFEFAADEIYNNSFATNTSTLIRTATNGTRYVMRNTVSDGSKSVPMSGGNIDIAGGVTVRPVNNPQFINSGWPRDFDWNKLYEWSDFIFDTWKDENVTSTVNVKWKTPVSFKLGDYVLFLSKVYKSKVANNHGHVPHGVTDQYWELQTWNDGGTTYTFPPDDYRLIDGDEYKQRNIGLTTETTVPPPANVRPVAHAGDDITITSPTSSVTLLGSGTDSDGVITAYAWRKISGPAAGTIQSATQAQTVVSALQAGVYFFELKVTDNRAADGKDTVKVTVNPGNIAPVVNAGNNQTITLPASTVDVKGTATDQDGSIASTAWAFISGPDGAVIENAAALQTKINNLAEGVYKFEFKATDNQGAVGRDTLTIVVNPFTPPNNIAPVASAGNNLAITLPVSTVSVTGQGTDQDGTIAGYAWKAISGPAQYTIATPASAQTSISNLVQGVYKFELKVTDNQGAVGRDTISVTVNAAVVPNLPPVADAGVDRTITLPENTVNLTGTGADQDGTISGYAWSYLSGPAGSTIASPASAQTTIRNLVQGSYRFVLKVTDNKGASGLDTVTITVNPAVPAPNKPPVANAGANRVITLPLNTVNLSGSATDADGTIVSYAWAYVSGPGQYAISSTTTAATTIRDLVAGIYRFELTVTDNQGATGKSIVTITVLPKEEPVNQAPVANADDDQELKIGTEPHYLNGAKSYDPDGTLVSYQWSQVSGPAGAVILSPEASVSEFTIEEPGEYVFQLTVIDDKGLQSSDRVVVTLLPIGSLVKLFPVPTTTMLNVQIMATTIRNNTVIEIYDSKGTLVYREEFLRHISSVIHPVDVSRLAKGAYIIRVGAALDDVKALKFVKL
ncbi:MAG: T9SS type A sorting domain-containing protein, partial [Chitinophagaceae bacterium]